MRIVFMRALIIFLIIMAGAGAFIVRTYYFAGEFKSIQPHYNGECIAVHGMPGSEDITIDQRHGLAFISSYNRRLYKAGLEVQGAIFSLDYKGADHAPHALTTGFKSVFHPHGINLYQDPDGQTFIFAINHTKRGNSVEIFEYKGGRLEHLETIKNPLMISPNDILAVGRRKFYISNDHGSTTSPGRIIEDFIPLKRSHLLYYDGETMTIAAGEIGGANGIAMSADGRTLYLSATTEKAIKVFKRDINTGSLTYQLSIPLGSFPDNIEKNEEGILYVACMPKALTYMAHKKSNKPAPSQIFRVAKKGNNDYSVEEVYYDDGKNINAATVAAPFRDGMLLGASRDMRNHILICRDKTAKKNK